MSAHLIDGEFQSDKYPTTPRGKVPLSAKDPTAQDLLWEYADRRQSVDAEFSADLRAALLAAGYHPAKETEVQRLRAEVERVRPVYEAAIVVKDRWTDDVDSFVTAAVDDMLEALEAAIAKESR